MTEEEAQALLAELPEVEGLTAEVRAYDNGTYCVHVQNGKSWICEFAVPDNLDIAVRAMLGYSA